MTRRPRGLHDAQLEGLDAGKESVLFPVLPVGAAPGQQPQCEREAQIAKFFGSQPRAAAAAGAVPAPLALPATPPKKRKEGC